MNSSAFLQTLGGNSLQAAALVLLVLSAQWIFRRQLTPTWRSALWLLVVARLLLPVSAGSAVSIFNLVPALRPALPAVSVEPVAEEFVAVAATEPSAAPAATTATPVPARFNLTWPQALLGVWLAGAAFLLSRMVVGSFRLARRVRGTACQDPAVLDVLDDCVRQTGLRRTPVLIESEAIATPAVFGLLRPRLLFPPGFRASFSPEQLRHVFLHELAHLRRHDLWVNSLMAVIQAIHWFNPLVWLGFARWRLDRELACDASALETLGDRHQRDYGETILQLLQRSPDRRLAPGLIGISEDRRQLRRRIAQIAAFQPTRRVPLLALALTIALAAIGLTDANAQKPASPTIKLPPPVAAKPSAEFRLIEFYVSDATTGQPVAEAKVDTLGRSISAAITDKNGLATLRVPISGSINRRVFTTKVSRPGYAPHELAWFAKKVSVRETLPDRQDVALLPGISIGGVVRDERGAPVPGATVTVMAPGQRNARGDGEDQSSYAYSALYTRPDEAPVTDANGAWQQDQVPPDLTALGLVVTRPGGAATLFTSQDEAVRPPSRAKAVSVAEAKAGPLVLSLNDGIPIRGVVLDEAGRPIVGAAVRARDATGRGSTFAQTSDAQGRFELLHWDVAGVSFTAEHPGYRTTKIIVPVEADAPDARIVMAPAVPLRLRVIGETGAPVANVPVRLHVVTAPGSYILDWNTTTDAGGRAEWPTAPADPVQIWVMPQDQPINATTLVADGQEHVIRLERNPGRPVAGL